MGLLGCTFFHPIIDYLVIGGLLSFPLMMLGDAFPQVLPQQMETALGIFLIVNGAHFAASTVRLYTKAGVAKANPIASIYAPLVCIALLVWALYSKVVTEQITAVYLTWSPYHYAAQTFGLASIYTYRSGCKLLLTEKRYLWWISMLPFVAALLTTPTAGVYWFAPASFTNSQLFGQSTLLLLVKIVNMAMLILPLVLFLSIRKRGANFPLIALVLLGTNAAWWLYLDYKQAWWWAALFHSLQYLFIVLKFHIDENFSAVTQREKRTFAAVKFYVISLFGAFLLFFAIPEVLAKFGFELVTAYLMVAYLVNIHHFFVDGFIWKSSKVKGPALGESRV